MEKNIEVSDVKSNLQKFLQFQEREIIPSVDQSINLISQNYQKYSSFLNQKIYKFLLIINNLITQEETHHPVDKNGIIIGRQGEKQKSQVLNQNEIQKVLIQQEDQLDRISLPYNGLDYEHLSIIYKSRSISDNIFQIKDHNSINGSFIKVNFAQIENNSIFEIGNTQFATVVSQNNQEIKLIIIKGPKQNYSYILKFDQNQSQFKVGKSTTNDIVIQSDYSIFSYHARIYKQNEKYFLEDISKTGIWIKITPNSQPIEAQFDCQIKIANAYIILLAKIQ